MMEKLERVSMNQYGFGIVSTNWVIEGIPAPGMEVADGGAEHHKKGESDWSREKGWSPLVTTRTSLEMYIRAMACRIRNRTSMSAVIEKLR